MNNQYVRGFTLVELMIVVVIVGIIAAIAMPSYRSYMVRSARAAVQTELLEMASMQERIFLNSNAYTTNLPTAYDGKTSGGLGKTGSISSAGKYDLQIVSAGQTFLMAAIPRAGSSQVGDGCLVIQENGVRQWNQNDDNGCDSDPPVLTSPVSW